MKYSEARGVLMDAVQKSMKSCRMLCGMSGVDLADEIGVSRQTVNSLEKEGTSYKITQQQCMCILAVYQNYTMDKPALKDLLWRNICANSLLAGKPQYIRYENGQDINFMDKWFETQPLKIECGADILDGDGLRQIVCRFRLFISSDSLLVENAKQALEELLSIMDECGKRLIVPSRVLEQVQMRRTQGTQEEQDRAQDIYNYLMEQRANGKVVVCGDITDPEEEDLLFESIRDMFREAGNLFFIVQDPNLAASLSDKREGEETFFQILCYSIAKGQFKRQEVQTEVSEEGEEPIECQVPDNYFDGPEFESSPATEEVIEEQL